MYVSHHKDFTKYGILAHRNTIMKETKLRVNNEFRNIN